MSATEDFGGEGPCRLTTVGRRTGRPRTVEINFVRRSGKLFFLAYGDSHWYRNLAANPNAWLQAGDAELPLRARWIDNDAYRVREVLDMFRAKYGEAEVARWYEGRDLYAVEAEVVARESAPEGQVNKG